MTKLLIVTVFLVSNCGTPKDQLYAANYTLAVATVQTDQYVYAYVGSDEGTHHVCSDLETEYGPKIQACGDDLSCQDDWEAKALLACQDRIRTLEERFDAALMTIYDSLESVDELLRGEASKTAAIAAAKDAVGAISHLLDLLKEYNMEIPKRLEDAMDLLGAIGG